MHDKRMPHFIVSISYGDINLSFYYTYSYSVLHVADLGGNLSLIASMLPTGW